MTKPPRDPADAPNEKPRDGAFAPLASAAVIAWATGHLTNTQALILAVIATWANYGEAHPTMDQIIGRSRRSERHVRRMIRDL